tara:strand:+ start:326 stop:772 length:447 start_codon:yes stop_codon:yes gene_type:complete
MKINILSVGKFKLNQPHKLIFDYYKKRIAFNIDLIELKLSSKERKIKLEKKQILKHIEKDDCVVTLDQSGKSITSFQFSKMLKSKIDKGCKKLSFVIGSDEGLDDYFKNSFENISFGNQTWPHLLVRVMLIEQIYRAFEIIKNTQYHK